MPSDSYSKTQPPVTAYDVDLDKGWPDTLNPPKTRIPLNISPELSPLHRDLSFLSPLSDVRATVLARFIADQAEGAVVDVACGWAELLTRVIEQAPDLRGIGIDLDGDAIAHGKDSAERRGVGDRMDFVVGDVKEHLPDRADAIICVGASQIWGPPAEANQPLDYRSALHALRCLLEPGKPAIFGEAIWTAEPTAEAIKPLAGRADEFVFLPELLGIAAECGFLAMRTHQATLDEWDQFESGFTAGYVRWLTENPQDHVNADEVRSRLAAQTTAYFAGYRNIMGMAYLELIAA